jgi:hypothetical protein
MRPHKPELTRLAGWTPVVLILGGLSACEFHCSAGSLDEPSVEARLGEPRVVGPLATEPRDVRKLSVEPVTTIYTDTETFFVGWAHPEVSAGDAIHAQLIVIDVGDIAPPGTVALETSLELGAGEDHGTFTFSIPANGWPAGRYRVEISRSDEPFGSVEFGISDSP